MSQEIATHQKTPTPGQLAREQFADLLARLTAPGGCRHVTVQFGSDRRGNLRMGTYILPAALTVAELADLKRLAGDTGPASEKRAILAAGLVVGSYRADQYANSDVFGKMLSTLLETFPGSVVAALLDLRDPDNLIRQSKFPPSIAEVCTWAENLIAKRKNLAKDVAYLISSASRYEAAKAESGENFFIEWEGDNRPSAEAVAEAEARHAKLFEREVDNCMTALDAAIRDSGEIDLSEFTYEILTEAKRRLVTATKA